MSIVDFTSLESVFKLSLISGLVSNITVFYVFGSCVNNWPVSNNLNMGVLASLNYSKGAD